MDEWDAIFHKDFITETDKKSYLEFLRNLLKGQAYVELAYMTGVLPIAKYSSGSEINMFKEYDMATKEKFSEYFGFSDVEVDKLFDIYQKTCKNAKITRESLTEWYDGYYTAAGSRMYNPRSVVGALTDDQISNYWTSSGPYDEIFYYIRNNVKDVRDDLAVMVSGESVKVKLRGYAVTSSELNTKEQIFSAMVVYGLLTYWDGEVSIPNRELMEKFDELLLSARDKYRVEREDKAGQGYVDFIFYPEDRGADALLLELKVDSTPEKAIPQIKDKNYALRLRGKIGERTKRAGRILAVGISYDRKAKKHCCRVEAL